MISAFLFPLQEFIPGHNQTIDYIVYPLSIPIAGILNIVVETSDGFRRSAGWFKASLVQGKKVEGPSILMNMLPFLGLAPAIGAVLRGDPRGVWLGPIVGAGVALATVYIGVDQRVAGGAAILSLATGIIGAYIVN